MNEQEFAELAAGKAMNALSPNDEERFDAALAQHPEWSSLADADAATAVSLSDSIADVTPPASVREALFARIDALTATDAVSAAAQSDDVPDADAPTTDAPATGGFDVDSLRSLGVPTTTDAVQTVQRRSWVRGMFGMAAALVLLIGLGFGAALINEQVNRSVDVVALDQIESAPDAEAASAQLADGGEVVAHWSQSVGKVVVVSDGLPRLATDQEFEMWFVRGGEAVSAGTFSSDGGDATSLLEGDMQAGDTIAITVEAVGGSSTGSPTTDPIVTIPTGV